MINFETVNEGYRDRVRFCVEDLFETLVKDHLLKGGGFDATKITSMFNESVRMGQLMVDLVIGNGLDPLKEESDGSNGRSPSGDEVGDFEKGDPEGPTRGIRDPKRVRDPAGQPDKTGDNRAAGSGQVNPPQQQPVSPEPGPGTRGGYGSGPSSLEVHTTPHDRPQRAGSGVSVVRGPNRSPQAGKEN